MTWLFLQTWLWHLAAFLLGALITWALFAQPWRRRRAATAGRHVNTEKRDGGAGKAELAAARKQVTTLRAELESCRANRAAEADANDRELTELRARLAGGATVLDAAPPNDTPLFDVDAPAPERAPLTGGATLLSERTQTAVATEPYSIATEPYTVTTEQLGSVVVTGPYGAGSAAALPDGSAPEGFTIKGNADSGLFHTVDSPWYRRTKAEAWFDTEESAIAAGFTHWKRKK